MMAKGLDNQEPIRTWLSGLAVTATTIVAYFAFWHLAPVTTFLVGLLSLFALISLSWHYGRLSRKRLEKAIEPPQQTSRDA